MSVGVLVVLIALIAAVAAFNKKESDPVAQATPVPTATATSASNNSSASPAASVSGSDYADGSYTSTGRYVSPNGNEQIEVTLTLQDDIVTAANVVSNATNPNAKQFQGEFINSYKSQVIGKDIDSLNLGKVSGSSLTPKGFNDALAKIKSEAKS
jgi:uncharacterized protein with FMN-binding domain